MQVSTFIAVSAVSFAKKPMAYLCIVLFISVLVVEQKSCFASVGVQDAMIHGKIGDGLKCLVESEVTN